MLFSVNKDFTKMEITEENQQTQQIKFSNDKIYQKKDIAEKFMKMSDKNFEQFELIVKYCSDNNIRPAKMLEDSLAG